MYSDFERGAELRKMCFFSVGNFENCKFFDFHGHTTFVFVFRWLWSELAEFFPHELSILKQKSLFQMPLWPNTEQMIPEMVNSTNFVGR